jgi:hypothetical protein
VTDIGLFKRWHYAIQTTGLFGIHTFIPQTYSRLPLSDVGVLQEKTKAMLPRIHVGHRIPCTSHSLAAQLSHCGMRNSSGKLLVSQLAAEIMVPFACDSTYFRGRLPALRQDLVAVSSV